MKPQGLYSVDLSVYIPQVSRLHLLVRTYIEVHSHGDGFQKRFSSVLSSTASRPFNSLIYFHPLSPGDGEVALDNCVLLCFAVYSHPGVL